jgi:hypothetical protein
MGSLLLEITGKSRIAIIQTSDRSATAITTAIEMMETGLIIITVIDFIIMVGKIAMNEAVRMNVWRMKNLLVMVVVLVISPSPGRRGWLRAIGLMIAGVLTDTASSHRAAIDGVYLLAGAAERGA